MPRYKLTIEYDGTNYSGWQIQPNAITVEEEIEKALHQILGVKVDAVGQGRTDAGVHAKGQTAHLDLPDKADVEKVIFGVNGLIGREIQVLSYEQVPGDFHARFDAVAREYEYTITIEHHPLLERFAWQLRQKADKDILQECATMLKGEWDFAGFSKYSEDNRTTLCEIEYSGFEIEGDVIRYRIKANRFLRNMVRRLTGTMVWVSQGKMEMKDFEELLKNPAAEIKSHTAPAKGLVLQKVFYKK